MKHPNNGSSRSALVVAIGRPSLSGGYGIALRSALRVYHEHFDRVSLLCCEDRPAVLPDEVKQWVTDVQFFRVPKRSTAWRFCLSLCSRLPAITVGYRSKQLRDLIRNLVIRNGSSSKTALIFEDTTIPLALGRWPLEVPNCEYVIHSYNVYATSFVSLARESNPISRKLWEFEISRIRRAEERCLRACSAVWAITQEDLVEYRRLFEFKKGGVLGVALDHQRYESVGEGSLGKVLYLGSTDVRKAAGLRSFITHSWPGVLKRFPDCEFVLGGPGTESFSAPASRIKGLGFVKDERDFLSTGAVFINPQESGSGIKLKSLVAMASGRALVSTPVGIEGVGGLAGTHYEVCSSAGDMTNVLLRVLENPNHARSLSRCGREFVRTHYGMERLLESSRHLFQPEDTGGKITGECVTSTATAYV